MTVTHDLLRAALDGLPRFALTTLPTPLCEATRLRTALGGSSRCPTILIKRDDLCGFALGGNKGRKLEFLIADALRSGADTVITTGATQSNHARMTAAAARVAGLKCHLVLTAEDRFGKATPVLEGNLLLDHLYGTTVHYVNDKDHENADGRKIRELERDLTSAGSKAYVIPVGGSNAVGVLGYVLASLELADQLAFADPRPSRLYYASGSRGTQAGLVLGAKLCHGSYELHGIAVSGHSAEKTERARRIAREAGELLQLSVPMEDEDFFTNPNFIGEGYGIPTKESLEAITLLARTEAILLDPSYTGKAMAALISDVRAGKLMPGETVIFLHTGGIPALFTKEFARRIDREGEATLE